MIIGTAQETPESSPNGHTEVLRYQAPINIYHKLPKPREIISPQLLGSREIRQIPGFEFREAPKLRGEPNLPETLNSNIIKAAGPPLGDQETLFQHYSQRKHLLVYDRNALQAETEETFNYLSYRPGAQSNTTPVSKCHTEKASSNNTYSSYDLNPQLQAQQPGPQWNGPALKFQSNFESGNLSKVYREGEHDYDLLLSSDINTTSYTQWFYFKVANSHSEIAEATFNIVNLMKSSSLYNKGMKILVHSSFDPVWVRSGQNILYNRNNLLLSSSSTRTYSTLKFSYSLQPCQVVYFAYTHPYTYSQLCEDLDRLEAAHLHSRIFWREVLCETPCGNRCEILTISKKPFRNKPTIFLSARVHPGQTVSSFVLNGMIQYLLSNRQEAQQLRNMFVWKIVPMLNPDGVIHGNYRCNLAGHDLNRRWQCPDPVLHPEIYHFKRYILKGKGQNSWDHMQTQCNRSLLSNYLSVGNNNSSGMSTASRSNVAMFIDLHGHSNKKNIFIYGCPDETAKEFPFLASKYVRGFSFKDCAFEVDSKKEGTARVALWRDLQIPNIFTVESSFCSFEDESFHFKVQDYEEVGRGLCKSIYLYYSRREKDMAIKDGCLKQLSSLAMSKELLINGNPNDSADSQEDMSPKKKPEKPIPPLKKITNCSLMKVTVGRTPLRPESPIIFADRLDKRINTEIRRYELQIPRIVDLTQMTPLKLPNPVRRRGFQKEQRLVREKFAIVSHGALSPIKNSPPKRMFHYGANFHFPQLKS